jgi:hypothetical protein
MDKLEFLRRELESLHKESLFNEIRTIEGPQGAWIVVNGKAVSPFLHFHKYHLTLLVSTMKIL